MLMKDVSAHGGGRGDGERSIGNGESTSGHGGRAEASSTHGGNSESSSTAHGGSSHGSSSEGNSSEDSNSEGSSSESSSFQSGHGGSSQGSHDGKSQGGHGGKSKKGGHHNQSGKPYSTSNLSQIAYAACSQLVSATATFCDSSSEYSSACFCVDPTL